MPGDEAVDPRIPPARRRYTEAVIRLTPDSDPAFLTLRRNLQVWTRRSFPDPGERFMFGRDAAVFQYFAGRGIVFHPLASFGRINALARICLERRRGRPGRERCRARTVRRGLDRLVALAARRGGFTAWEYVVAYGGGTPPWISGMAQATAIQALARGSEALDTPRWRRVADSALAAFKQPPPTGVRVTGWDGVHYAMYSFAPDLRILNGSLQSLLGLYDMADLSGSALARRLYLAAEPAARRAVTAHDTGAWSLYARAGRESPASYHRIPRQRPRTPTRRCSRWRPGPRTWMSSSGDTPARAPERQPDDGCATASPGWGRHGRRRDGPAVSRPLPDRGVETVFARWRWQR